MKKTNNNLSIEDLKKSQYRLIIYLSILVFCVLLIYTIIWEVNYNNKYGYFIKTEAIVIEYEYDGNLKYDVLEYFDKNNVLCRKTTTYQSKNEIGDKITIYYDENNSSSGVIYSIDSKTYLLPIITILFGLTSIGIIVMYFVLFKSKLKKGNKSKKAIKYNKFKSES